MRAGIARPRQYFARTWIFVLVAFSVILLLGAFLLARVHHVETGVSCGSVIQPSESGSLSYSGVDHGCEAVLSDAGLLAYPLFAIGLAGTLGLGLWRLIRGKAGSSAWSGES